MERELGASYGFRASQYAWSNAQHRERRPDSVQVVLLVRLNHHVRGGLGRACKSKGPALTRPGRLGHQASRASRPTERRESRPSGATAALSQRRPCRRGCCTSGRAGEHKARRLLVRLEEAAAAHVHRARHDLRRGRRRGVTGGSGGRGRRVAGRVRRVQAWEEGREAR